MSPRGKERRFTWKLPSSLFVICCVLWLVLVGSLHRDELLMGIVLSILATAFLAFVHSREGLELELCAADLLQCVWIPWYVVSGLVEILIVFVKDVGGIQPAKSLYLISGFRALHSPRGIVRRALAVVYTNATPNFIVLSIAPENSRMLYHALETSSMPRMTRNLGAVE